MATASAVLLASRDGKRQRRQGVAPGSPSRFTATGASEVRVNKAAPTAERWSVGLLRESHLDDAPVAHFRVHPVELDPDSLT